MSHRKEITLFVVALLITGGLVGGAIWWLIARFNVDLSNLPNRTNSGGPYNLETFDRVQGVPRGLFNYGGSTVWATIRKEVDPTIATVWPQFRLHYIDPPNGTPSSSTGVRMLLDNQLDFSQSSGTIGDAEYQLARQRGFKLKEVPVAIDAIAIIVNPNLDVSGLTVAEFEDIYSGKIKNWNEVGGPDLKILPYGKRFRDFGSQVQFVETTTEAVRKVAANLGAIYYSSAPLLVPQCTVKSLPIGHKLDRLVSPYKEPFIPLSECPGERNQVNIEAILNGEYPLTRRLVVVIKQNGQVAEQAGEAYAKLLLTDQGQESIEKAGLLPVR